MGENDERASSLERTLGETDALPDPTADQRTAGLTDDETADDVGMGVVANPGAGTAAAGSDEVEGEGQTPQ